MTINYDHYSTVCSGCARITGRHWYGGRGRRSECHSEGISVSDKKPCPHCGGEKLAGFRGDFPLGTSVSDSVKMTKCKCCGIAVKITDPDGSVLHEDINGKNGRCGECHIATFLEQHPDPSDATRRFKFERFRVEWELSRVKVVCPDCKKDRWIAPANVHKPRCEKCYQGKVG